MIRALDIVCREFIENHEIASRANATINAAKAEASKVSAALAGLEVELTDLFSSSDTDVAIIHEKSTILIPQFGKPRLINKVCVRL